MPTPGAAATESPLQAPGVDTEFTQLSHPNGPRLAYPAAATAATAFGQHRPIATASLRSPDSAAPQGESVDGYRSGATDERQISYPQPAQQQQLDSERSESTTFATEDGLMIRDATRSSSHGASGGATRHATNWAPVELSNGAVFREQPGVDSDQYPQTGHVLMDGRLVGTSGDGQCGSNGNGARAQHVVTATNVRPLLRINPVAQQHQQQHTVMAGSSACAYPNRPTTDDESSSSIGSQSPPVDLGCPPLHHHPSFIPSIRELTATTSTPGVSVRSNSGGLYTYPTSSSGSPAHYQHIVSIGHHADYDAQQATVGNANGAAAARGVQPASGWTSGGSTSLSPSMSSHNNHRRGRGTRHLSDVASLAGGVHVPHDGMSFALEPLARSMRNVITSIGAAAANFGGASSMAHLGSPPRHVHNRSLGSLSPHASTPHGSPPFAPLSATLGHVPPLPASITNRMYADSRAVATGSYATQASLVPTAFRDNSIHSVHSVQSALSDRMALPQLQQTGSATRGLFNVAAAIVALSPMLLLNRSLDDPVVVAMQMLNSEGTRHLLRLFWHRRSCHHSA